MSTFTETIVNTQARGEGGVKMFLRWLRAPSNHRYVSELEDLIKHCWIHNNYKDCGYGQMTTRQKQLYDKIKSEPWSFENSSRR